MLCSVQTRVGDPPAAGTRQRVLGAAIVAGLTAALLGLFEGFVGFTSVTPGASLATTCALVATMGLIALTSGWVLLRRQRHSVPVRVFVVGTVLFGAAAVWWTWSFAMPTAMRWDPGATSRAQAALRGIGEDRSVCASVRTGVIGPLEAPYRQCAINGPPGSTVEYLVLSGEQVASPSRGLVHSDAPETTFSGECPRHLVGDWYAVTSDPSGLIGYTCRGGG